MTTKAEKVVLTRVNQIRKQFGLKRITKLRKGTPCMNKRCVIAESLSDDKLCASVTSNSWTYYKSRGHRYDCFSYAGSGNFDDDVIMQFIKDFDHNEYPHLTKQRV